MLDRTRFETLAQDHTRGATAITRDLCSLLDEAFRAIEWNDPARATAEALLLLDAVENVRPSFAGPARLAANCRAFLRSVPASELLPRLLALLAAEREMLAMAVAEIARRAERLVPARGLVVTISASETVRATLLAAHAAGRRPRVLAGESRPLREGVPFARALTEAGLDVTVLADAALPGLVTERATVFVGADRLAEDVLVGKIGCYPLALACARTHRPFIALADSRKVLPRSMAAIAEETFDPAEIAPVSDGVTARNVYFEHVPLRLVSRIVTEAGVWTRGEVRRRALQLPRRMRPDRPA